MVSKKGFMGIGIAGLAIMAEGGYSLLQFFIYQQNTGRLFLSLVIALYILQIGLQSGYMSSQYIMLLTTVQQQLRMANIMQFTYLTLAIVSIIVGGILALVGWINYAKNK